MDGLTTIYCDKPTHAYIFDSTGVRTVTLSDGYRIPELDADPQCCALVNLGDRLTVTNALKNVFIYIICNDVKLRTGGRAG
jgi:hypothetical protein